MDVLHSWIMLFVGGQIVLSLLASCSLNYEEQRNEADRINTEAYLNRYKDLDLSLAYADSALTLSKACRYNFGQCQALCSKAFYMQSKMRYGEVDSLLSLANSIASDKLSRLNIEVGYMRLCQRRALNKEFYVHREAAERIINSIHNSPRKLLPQEYKLYTYCRSEYGIILSAYFYYVGREQDSEEALATLASDKDINMQADTAQWLAYLYNIEDVELCKLIARRSGLVYWEANALQLESENLMSDSGDPVRYHQLATDALNLFMKYGDTYQTAAAWRTMADSYGFQHDYENMLNSLLVGLNDSLVYQSPTMIASIDERLSIAYSALDNKYMADVSRNAFLDIQDSTRQDRQLEARIDSIHQELHNLNIIVLVIIGLIAGMIIFSNLMIRQRKKRGFYNYLSKLADRTEELNEECNMLKLQISDARRLSAEQHAKISLVQSMQPLIDRMHVASTRFDRDAQSKEYLAELCSSISEGNELLTRWIQLRKGDVKLRIETFPVQQLFDIIIANGTAFSANGISLVCEPTDVNIKADKALTFFMLNTLTDNARKFTPEGGTISLSCKPSEVEGYADVIVSDTGRGMTPEQAEHLFEYRVIEDGGEDLKVQKSHGFGLMNCRGIIDRCKKASSIFSQSAISATSCVGKGTSVTFRLPQVVKTLALLAVMMTSLSGNGFAQQRASDYGDSMYVCNINGRYADCLNFADSCRYELNKYYLSLGLPAADTLSATNGEAEVKWLRDSVDVDYDLILAMRNESAVAALALHEWKVYHVNNNAYRTLYKEFTADRTLDGYCSKMEHYESAITIALIVLALVIVGIVLFFYRYYVQDYFLARRNLNDQISQLEDTAAKLRADYSRLYVSNNIADNCLSTIKHETMYYPSRINHLLETDAADAQIAETISYYRTLYELLASHCQMLLSDVPMIVGTLRWGDLETSCSKFLDVECDTDPEVQIIGNEELLRYVFLMLKKKNNDTVILSDFVKDEDYLRISLTCNGLSAAIYNPANIFQLQTPDHDFLIIKQILREIGDASVRYGSGITATSTETNRLALHIALPLKK